MLGLLQVVWSGWRNNFFFGKIEGQRVVLKVIFGVQLKKTSPLFKGKNLEMPLYKDSKFSIWNRKESWI